MWIQAPCPGALLKAGGDNAEGGIYNNMSRTVGLSRQKPILKISGLDLTQVTFCTKLYIK
ncbi:hypothetical protein CR205_01360 [Alteribacter lacisalsi]|uniref:Uncharacterized protein n=1 Tax=Alteribacter lacisalsi TaxID=2045244 RepID=A0A2W0H5Z5_9BACI|nr:hypothetical protein CR205_01360 [Alteribacter lacisalsi]